MSEPDAKRLKLDKSRGIDELIRACEEDDEAIPLTSEMSTELKTAFTLACSDEARYLELSGALVRIALSATLSKHSSWTSVCITPLLAFVTRCPELAHTQKLLGPHFVPVLPITRGWLGYEDCRVKMVTNSQGTSFAGAVDDMCTAMNSGSGNSHSVYGDASILRWSRSKLSAHNAERLHVLAQRVETAARQCQHYRVSIQRLVHKYLLPAIPVVPLFSIVIGYLLSEE